MGSVNDPRNPEGRLIAAGQVKGAAVYDMQGARLGRVEDVMLDKITGRIAYAVLSFGGFLGLGDKHHPMPWAAMHYDQSLDGYVVNLSREMLEGAPAYNAGDAVRWGDEGWGRRVHDYYHTPPYWDAVA